MDRQFARAIRAYLALAEHRPASEDGRAGSQKQQGLGGSKETERAEAAAELGSRESRAVSSLGAGAGTGGAGAGAGAGEGQYAHVFRMIEQHSLFDTVQVSRRRVHCSALRGARGEVHAKDA